MTRFAPECRFTLRLQESGEDGQLFKLFVPVLIYSAHAEWCAEHLNAGDLIVVDGKLRYHTWLDKAGLKQSKLAVMAWAVSHLAPAPAVSTN